MLPAIQLNTELIFMTMEIEHVGSDRPLTPELEPQQLTIAKNIP
jgi:hypothetical protein